MKRMKLLMAATLLMGGVIVVSACGKTSTAVSGNYSAYLEGYDWGENISRVTLKLDQKVDSKTISAKDFTILEKKETFDWTKPNKGVFKTKSSRKIEKAYVSDKNGHQVKKNSQYITMKLAVGPNDGRYFFQSPDSPSSQYPNFYELQFGLSPKSNLTSGGKKVSKLTIKSKAQDIKTSVDYFKKANYKAEDGVKYQYAYYEPVKSSDTLVVWLHGLLEGGSQNTDAYVPLLGNEAANLAGKEFQKIIGGANILVPQCPSFWMDKTGKDKLVDGKIISDGTSYYTKSLHELIGYYKEKIGAKKVIIAGCSNGGYMGMILARDYGKEYDAYMLLCEAMENRYVTDEDIQKIKDLPLYLVYSKDDQTVIPEESEIPTIERLRAAGASNLKVSVYDHVLDTSGKILNDKGEPYNFGGHSVWVPFFNNEVISEDGIHAWQWLAQQINK
jgi:predicted peptidase